MVDNDNSAKLSSDSVLEDWSLIILLLEVLL